MDKKISILLLLILSFNFNLSAEWKTDILDYFGSKKDYKGATDYLKNNFEKIDDIYKPVVCGLLAYSFNKLGQKNNEHKWLIEYFETYKGRGPILNFLDDSTNTEITDYVKKWQRKYPLITDIALINGKIYHRSFPPAKILIGIDIRNDAYYKLSDKENIIKGGLLIKGFNLINIDAYYLFEKSESHLYFLGIKAGDLILKKEIEINIKLDSHEEAEKAENEIENIEYKLFMFIGDQLIVSSKKFFHKKLPLKIEIPPPSGEYRPFGPVVDKSDPFLNSFSIFTAAAGIYELIKSLKSGKNTGKKADSIQKLQQITTTFLRKNSEGIEKEVKAVITIRTRSLDIPPGE